MSNTCKHVLRVFLPNDLRQLLCIGLLIENATGLMHPLFGGLLPLQQYIALPGTVRYADDGAWLSVYWEADGDGPNLPWCDRLALAFPTAIVRLDYLVANDGGAGRLSWNETELVEEIDLYAYVGDAARVAANFHRLAAFG